MPRPAGQSLWAAVDSRRVARRGRMDGLCPWVRGGYPPPMLRRTVNVGLDTPQASGQATEATKLEALRAAIGVGLEDSRTGRIVTIAPGDELAFVRSLGLRPPAEN